MEEKSNCWEEQYQPHKEMKKDEDGKISADACRGKIGPLDITDSPITG